MAGSPAVDREVCHGPLWVVRTLGLEDCGPPGLVSLPLCGDFSLTSLCGISARPASAELIFTNSSPTLCWASLFPSILWLSGDLNGKGASLQQISFLTIEKHDWEAGNKYRSRAAKMETCCFVQLHQGIETCRKSVLSDSICWCFCMHSCFLGCQQRAGAVCNPSSSSCLLTLPQMTLGVSKLPLKSCLTQDMFEQCDKEA